jgi:SAM-dependent methyltransferase
MKMSGIEKFFVNNKRRQRSRVELARKLLGAVDLAGAVEYLEIGCGTGAVSRYAATELQLDATGVDIDPEQIAVAEHNASAISNIRFLEADAARLPFEDGRFDIVLSFMATHHITELASALAEIKRVLKPGGYFVYSDIFLPGPIAFMGSVFGHGYHLPPSDRLMSDLADAGFEAIRTSRPAGKFYGHLEVTYRLNPAATRARELVGARTADA